jgi:hypothetical protein
MTSHEINGLPLPPRLIQALDDGTWTPAGKNWSAVFPAEEIGRIELFSIEKMRKLNEQWWRHEIADIFYGVADGRVMPGDLHAESSLWLGEVENEALFALDYRAAGGRPSVVFLNTYSRWVAIAPNFDDFWNRLGGAP